MLRRSGAVLLGALGAAIAVQLAPIGAGDDATTAAAAEAARRGPPWISIEYPPNPHDPASRNAFLLVNAFHHETPMALPVTGKAEGVVNGERRSIALELDRTSRPGVYALRPQWPAEGTWVLALTVHQSESSTATALVALAPNGTVASVEVPVRRQGEWTVPRAVGSAEIEALLARRVAAR